MGITAISEENIGTAAKAGRPPGQIVWVQFAVIAGLAGVLYAWTLVDLSKAWWTNPSFSQGMLIPPLAAYLAWLSRGRTLAQPAVSDSWGLSLALFSCLLFLVGKLGAEFFLQRISFVLLLAALTWTFWGRARLRTLAFPFLLLATMVPLPALIYNAATAPLQLLASQLSTQIAQACGVSMYQDGNIMHLATTSLGVEEACSGLNSLSALMVGSLLLGHVYSCRPAARVILFALSLPIAIAFNILRVAGTAILADSHEELALGFYHSFSGWLVFVAGFGALYLAARLVRCLFGQANTPTNSGMAGQETCSTTKTS